MSKKSDWVEFLFLCGWLFVAVLSFGGIMWGLFYTLIGLMR